MSDIISDMNGLFELAGLNIISNEDKEIVIKVTHKGVIARITKSIFAQYNENNDQITKSEDSSTEYNINIDPKRKIWHWIKFKSIKLIYLFYRIKIIIILN